MFVLLQIIQVLGGKSLFAGLKEGYNDREQMNNSFCFRPVTPGRMGSRWGRLLLWRCKADRSMVFHQSKAGDRLSLFSQTKVIPFSTLKKKSTIYTSKPIPIQVTNVSLLHPDFGLIFNVFMAGTWKPTVFYSNDPDECRTELLIEDMDLHKS